MVHAIGIHTRLKPGAVERYEEYHKQVWPDYDRAIAELAEDPVNIKWQAEMAPMMAVAHDYSGQSRDCLPLIFEL
jgi:L-rhamnose mutarotase